MRLIKLFIVIAVMFGTVFFIDTAVFDHICRATGYYSEGLAEVGR